MPIATASSTPQPAIVRQGRRLLQTTSRSVIPAQIASSRGCQDADHWLPTSNTAEITPVLNVVESTSFSA